VHRNATAVISACGFERRTDGHAAQACSLTDEHSRLGSSCSTSIRAVVIVWRRPITSRQMRSRPTLLVRSSPYQISIGHFAEYPRPVSGRTSLRFVGLRGSVQFLDSVHSVTVHSVTPVRSDVGVVVWLLRRSIWQRETDAVVLSRRRLPARRRRLTDKRDNQVTRQHVTTARNNQAPLTRCCTTPTGRPREFRC
jgi:hypothetical protein